MSWYYNKPYVSAAEKAKKLEKKLKQLTKGGYVLSPVKLEGRVIAKTFWGKAWCENLERYSDLENRLPRGRTYVRNGSVVDLKVAPGSVSAMVNGSALYDVVMKVEQVSAEHWKAIRTDCAGGIDSLVELLQGKLSKAVMERICEPDKGLFPKPKEIKMSCNCPDYADVCKHIAAVIYGIGARLDEQPELLFRLRQVDPQELIATTQALDLPKPRSGSKKVLASDDLAGLFGLDIEGPDPVVVPRAKKVPSKATTTAEKPSTTSKKKPAVKRAPLAVVPAKRAAVKGAKAATTKTAPRKAATKKAAPRKTATTKAAPKKAAARKSAPKGGATSKGAAKPVPAKGKLTKRAGTVKAASAKGKAAAKAPVVSVARTRTTPTRKAKKARV